MNLAAKRLSNLSQVMNLDIFYAIGLSRTGISLQGRMEAQSAVYVNTFKTDLDKKTWEFTEIGYLETSFTFEGEAIRVVLTK